MTNIEYAYVPTCDFEVQIVAASGTSIFNRALIRRERFDTSKEAIEYVRSITPEDAITYKWEGSCILVTPVDHLNIGVTRFIYEERRDCRVYRGEKAVMESCWDVKDDSNAHEMKAGEPL